MFGCVPYSRQDPKVQGVCRGRSGDLESSAQTGRRQIRPSARKQAMRRARRMVSAGNGPRAALVACFRQGRRYAPRLSRCFAREGGTRRARRVVSSGNGPRAALVACFRPGRRYAPRLSRPFQVVTAVGRLVLRHPPVCEAIGRLEYSYTTGVQGYWTSRIFLHHRCAWQLDVSYCVTHRCARLLDVSNAFSPLV